MIFVDHSDAGDLLSQLFQHRLQKQHIVPVLRQKRLIKVVGQIAICHNKLFGTLKIVFRHTSQQLTELRQYTAFIKPERSCVNCAAKSTCLKRSMSMFVLYIQTGRSNELTAEIKENFNRAGDCANWKQNKEED